MAHQSGYGGSITWDEDSLWAPPWNATIQSWDLYYRQRQYETPVMGSALQANAWPTVTLGMSEWRAHAVYLISDDLVSGLYGGLAIGLEVMIHLNMNNNPDFFFGTGITETGTVNAPLDGPITGTMSIRGITQLEHESAP